MKKSSKSGVISTSIVFLVLIALLNVFTFVIPFNKISDAVLLTAYIMAEVVLVVLGLLIVLLIFNEEDANQRILSIPMIQQGFITLGVQLVATIVFYICNAYIKLPIWIVVVVESLIIGYLIVQFSLGFFFKTRTKEYKESIGNTKFIDNYRAEITVIVRKNKNKNIEKQLENLFDVVRGADPVSSDVTNEVEVELSILLKSFYSAVEEGLESDTLQLIEKIQDKIIERNVICKANK